MTKTCRTRGFVGASILAVAWVLAWGSASAIAEEVQVTLSGEHEVPPVTTSARGTAVFTIGKDKSVKGTVTTSGVDGIAAHIHMAPPGENGPPVITLVKVSNNVWSTPDGAKLTDDQYEQFKAGHLYVNVHSQAHRAGEIRGQLKP